MVACVVAAFCSHGFGSKKQRRTDTPATSKTLVATEGVEHLGRLAFEPTVVELSDGTLFVSGYDNDAEQSPGLWRSRDHGATWESVNVGKKTAGAIGDSDVDLAVGPDDTVYFVAMTYDGKKHEGTGIAVGAVGRVTPEIATTRGGAIEIARVVCNQARNGCCAVCSVGERIKHAFSPAVGGIRREAVDDAATAK